MITVTQSKSWTTSFVPWWPLVLLVLMGLGMLAVAETVWLPEAMPREYVARTSLAFIPSPSSVAVLRSDWADIVLDRASQDELLASIISRLDLRSGASGEPLSPTQLRQHMKVSAQCIEVAKGQGSPVQGVLLSATVRGWDNAELAAIADTWADAFVRSSPLLGVPPIAASHAPYLPCGEH